MSTVMRNKSDCYCVNLRRAANIMTEIYDKHLEAADITLPQYCLLSNLRKMDGCSVSDLANGVGLERTTLVRTLKPLTARGLISDISEPGTRRRKLHLTEEGLKIVAKAKPLWVEAQNEIEQRIGKENAAVLLQLSEKL
ncbi:MAG: MarR family winged helix-turn-helix transcriptional regulator [Lachnospiraceae bacterium]|nr:MarR family winged helix-turn-helix transcriptional regulator [Lachnospiraceae bacterium]